jgi:hypothetical protein
MRFGPDYFNARQMQTKLLQVVCDGKVPPRDAALCARAWIDLERLKREIRGIPPLAPASVKELNGLLDNMKRAKRAAAFEPRELGAGTEN